MPAQPRGSALWKVNFTLSCDGTIIIWNQLFGVKICIDVEFKLGHHFKPLALLSWLLHGGSAALLAGGVARRVPSLSCRRLWIGRGCSAALRRGRRCPSAVHTVAAPHMAPSASLGACGGGRRGPGLVRGRAGPRAQLFPSLRLQRPLRRSSGPSTPRTVVRGPASVSSFSCGWFYPIQQTSFTVLTISDAQFRGVSTFVLLCGQHHTVSITAPVPSDWSRPPSATPPPLLPPGPSLTFCLIRGPEGPHVSGIPQDLSSFL